MDSKLLILNFEANDKRSSSTPIISATMVFVATTSDSKYAISVSSIGPIIFWDLETFSDLLTLEAKGELVAGTLSANDKYIIIGGDNGILEFWDLTQRNYLRILEGHLGVITTVAITADSEYVVSGGTDGQIRIGT